MTVVRGHVEGGRIVIDEPVNLPEGAEVEVALLDDDLSPEERVEAERAIDLGLDEMERGETVSADDVLRRLRDS